MGLKRARVFKMPKKGVSNNPKGRQKGVPNKATTKFKDALNELLEHCADDMLMWLKDIDDPKQRFDVLKDFAEYIHPKLSRRESQQLDENGNPIAPQAATTLVNISKDV